MAPIDQLDRARRRALVFLWQRVNGMSATDQHQCVVVGDAIEPRTDLYLWLKPVERLKSGDERSLNDLFCIVRLLEQSHSQPIDSIRIRFKKLGERRFVMPEKPSQEFLIIRHRRFSFRSL